MMSVSLKSLNGTAFFANKMELEDKEGPGKGENLFVTPRQQTNLII